MTTPFVVDQIFPTNQIHLVYGPARSGKTTLMLQIMNDWSRSQPVLTTYVPHPAPYCWVSCERNTESIRSHMRKIGMDPDEIPHFSLLDLEMRDNQTIDAAIALARKRIPGLAVMFIDGLHALCEGRLHDSKDVTKFMILTHQLMRQNKLTIVATISSPKSRPDETATPPGERFIGSVAWASTTDCKILIEPLEVNNPQNPGRKVFVMPSHQVATISTWEFNKEGLLEFKFEQNKSPLDIWLESMVDFDTEFETHEVIVVAESAGLSSSTAERWLRKAIEKGRIYKVETGKYRKTKPV